MCGQVSLRRGGPAGVCPVLECGLSFVRQWAKSESEWNGDSSSDHDAMSLSSSAGNTFDNKPLSSSCDGRGSGRRGESVDGEHQVAGSGVGTLCRKPLLAKSQADRRAGRKEMLDGISWRFLRKITYRTILEPYVVSSEVQKMVLE